MLGIGRTHLYKLTKTGRIKSRKLGSRTVYPAAEIARILEPGTED